MIEKVRTGQNVELKASVWNSFINAANYVSSVQQSSFSKPHQGGLDNIVLVKNLTGRTYPQFAALGLSDMILKPVNVDEFKNRSPVFAGVQITTANKTLPFAILLEPLQANEIGKAMVLGVVQMQIFINKEKDQFAVPKPDSYSGEMHSSDSGVARILWKAGVSGLQWCVLQLGGAGSGNAGPPAYNGFFTLKDVSTFNEEDGTVKEFRVAVCDGATWKQETQTSGASKVACGSNTLYFDCKILTVTESCDIYIKCGYNSTYKNEIIAVKTGEKPSRIGYIYYLVGSVELTPPDPESVLQEDEDKPLGALTIIQRHGVSYLAPVEYSGGTFQAGHNGMPMLQYNEFTGYFAVRHVEEEDSGQCALDQVLVCHGKYLSSSGRNTSSYASCNNCSYSFPPRILNIDGPSDIYVVCGADNSCKHDLVVYPSGENPAAPGYSFYRIASIDVTGTGLNITQVFNGDGTLYMPYEHYTGDFAVRAKENTDGTFDLSSLSVQPGGIYVNGSYRYVEGKTLSAKDDGQLMIKYNPKTDTATIEWFSGSGSQGNVARTDEEGISFGYSKIGYFRNGTWQQSKEYLPHTIWVLTTICERNIDKD